MRSETGRGRCFGLYRGVEVAMSACQQFCIAIGPPLRLLGLCRRFLDDALAAVSTCVFCKAFLLEDTGNV